MPTLTRWEVVRGDDFSRVVRRRVNGAIDLSIGWTLKCEVRAGDADTSPVLLTLCSGSPVAGEWAIRATAAQTGALPAGNYFVDIKTVDPSGKVRHQAERPFRVRVRRTS